MKFGSDSALIAKTDRGGTYSEKFYVIPLKGIIALDLCVFFGMYVWILQEYGRGTSTGFKNCLLLLWFPIAFFSLWSVSYQNSRRFQESPRLKNLKSLWMVHTFLGEPITNGKKSAKFVRVSQILLMNCRFISEKNFHLSSGCREGNRKSPRNAALIINSSSEIPGISELFWYLKTLSKL